MSLSKIIKRYATPITREGWASVYIQIGSYGVPAYFLDNTIEVVHKHSLRFKWLRTVHCHELGKGFDGRPAIIWTDEQYRDGFTMHCNKSTVPGRFIARFVCEGVETKGWISNIPNTKGFIAQAIRPVQLLDHKGVDWTERMIVG